MPFKPYELGQRSLFGYEPTDCLDSDDPAFFVAEVVGQMNLSGLKCQGEGAGQPPYHPKMMVSTLIYAMMRGIHSSRALAAACRRDMGFIHLAAGRRPCFKTICNFRNTHGEAIRRLMAQVLAVAASMRLDVGGSPVLDSTRIRACANRDKMIRSDDYDRALDAVEAYLSRARITDEEEDEQWGGQNGYYLPKSVRKDPGRLEQLKQAIKEAQASDLKALSPTDIDCREMRESNTARIRPGYALQAAIDKDSGLITVCDVTAEQSDNSFAPEAVRQHKQNTGKKPGSLDADSGYFEAGAISDMEEDGIDVCIPDSNTAAELHRERGKEKKADKQTEGATGDKTSGTAERQQAAKPTLEDFEPVEGRDKWRCPAGRQMQKVGRFTRDGRNYTRYRCKERCTGCDIAARCLRKSDRGRRTIEISEGHPTVRKNRQRFKEEAHRRRYKKRGSFIEHIFGHLKRNLRFIQWLHRGLNKVKTTAALFAIAFNIMVLARHLAKSA